MTTKIDVIIKGIAELLQKIKEVQDEERKKYELKKKEKKEKEEVEEEAAEEQQKQDDEYKGAVADPEEEDKPENKPKSRKCGHWIYKDFVQGRSGTGWELYPRVRYRMDDIMQYSVGSGDGTQWATHYINSPSGRNWQDTVITGSMEFIGYLSYVQFYAPGSGFGTVYQLPEGAIETPYDPMVYLQSTSSNWGLYFPDELNSGEAKYRRMITIQKKRSAGNQPQINQAQVCFPINNKKSIIIVPTWMSWITSLGAESYDSPPPSAGYFLHPQNTSQPSVKYTVYYKNPGTNTGWTPINGFYWVMNPADETDILSLSELAAIMPLSSTYVFSHNHKWDVAGFVVSHKKARKLDNIPDEVLNKIRARYPEAPWDTTFGTNNNYNFLDVIDKTPGYPTQIDDIYNIESWEFNPDSQCMGIARNLFGRSDYDSGSLPYDYWFRDNRMPVYVNEGDVRYSSFDTHRVLGISPGAYDYYDADLQDHAFYNHFGKGSWYDSWDFTYSTRDSWVSEYGEVRLHAKDVSKNTWNWFNGITQKALDLGDANRYQLTKNDIAWIYLNKEQREAYINNYKEYSTDPAGLLEYALEAPDNPEFNYVYMERNVDNQVLVDGVKWIGEGYMGTWTSADEPPFDYNSDPFYDAPYMDPEDSRWKRYGLKHKLSPSRQWPPSVSAGISDPIPANASAAARADHPLAKGTALMTLVINTAWDNDYSAVLLAMGFEPRDLVP